MPIYEFYCEACHTIFQFFGRSMGTTKRPACPRCGAKRLPRAVSRFAITGKAKEPGDLPDELPFDENKMMQAMARMESETGSIDENDPRAAAAFMRRFSQESGLPLNDAMHEAIRRMENGENPENIEKDLGDELDQFDPLAPPKTALAKLRKRLAEPDRDPELYDL